MITLNIQNSLSPKLNKKHGLNKEELFKSLEKYGHIKDKLKKRKDLGFLQLPFQDSKQIRELEKKASELRRKFKHIIVIGIGGSCLGSLALYKTLKPFYNEKPEIIFIDNPDNSTVNHYLRNLDFDKTLLIPISKSGNTVESLAIFSIFYKKLGKNAAKQVLAITEKNEGTLYKIAQKEGFPILEIPKNVGGRFSVFSPVGLLPAALAGINIQKLLEGAKSTEIETAYLLALLQYLMYQKGKEITVFFGYNNTFAWIADWYIQLLAESIGKSVKIGPTPVKAIGPSDQHSQLQLFMEGPNNKWLIFLKTLEKSEKNVADKVTIPDFFQEFEPFTYLKNRTLLELTLAEQEATAEALARQNRPNIALTLSNLQNEETVGELLFLLELQVALLGELFQINAFDQPGVELGKKLTKDFLLKHSY